MAALPQTFPNRLMEQVMLRSLINRERISCVFLTDPIGPLVNLRPTKKSA